ncbi:MAG TPA: DUF1579 domain-containing protein [Candidatus Hydrogenedentes bacterium]|nr:DUF1579 domain-containing protein [Candidatus Hydrogenedentota bacterium]
MKTTCALAALLMLFPAAMGWAEEPAIDLEAMMAEMPKPTAEHEWLKQLVGEWETEATITMGPGAEPITHTGTETVEAIGGFWVMGRNEGICTLDGSPFTGIMTLGYDPAKEKYVGTWVDSMNSHLWTYEGTVDAAGKTLTLETEGMSPANPEETCKFRDVMELKGRDERVFTSSFEGPDGEWMKMVAIKSRRVK